MDLESIFSNGLNNIITLEATVDTGFESVALEECNEIFGEDLVSSCKARGRVFLSIKQDQFEKVHCLRSIDNLFLVGAYIPDLGFSPNQDKEIDLETIKTLAGTLDWKSQLRIWTECSKFEGILYPTQEEHNLSSQTKIEQLEKLTAQNVLDRISITNILNSMSNVLRFRVTCNRSGKHTFGSMDAARDFGGRLHDIFHWVVDLTSFNIDIVLNISENKAYVSLGLTRRSKHRRNISFFGPTTLRATVCYSMLRLASPKPGDVVIDPLCGGGSIPIEGSIAYPSTFQLCGDYHEKAVNRCRNNIDSLSSNKTSLATDVVQWDATKLPLKTSSVDVFVTDLPFGKRSGHKKDNRVLYKEVLVELSRVVRPGSGRAVILTHDRRTFVRAVPQTGGMWKQTKILGVNLGGLQAGVFQLARTSKLFIK